MSVLFETSIGDIIFDLDGELVLLIAAAFCTENVRLSRTVSSTVRELPEAMQGLLLQLLLFLQCPEGLHRPVW